MTTTRPRVVPVLRRMREQWERRDRRAAEPAASGGSSEARADPPADTPAEHLRHRANSQGETPLLLRELVLGPPGVGIVRSPQAVRGFVTLLWNLVGAVVLVAFALAVLVVVVWWAVSVHVEMDVLAGRAVRLLTSRSGLLVVVGVAGGTTAKLVVRKRARRE